VHNIFLEFGFVRVGVPLQAHKTGSKESNTLYVYERVTDGDAESSVKVEQLILSCQRHQLCDKDLTQLLHRAWDDANGRQQYYREVFEQASVVLSKHRLSHSAVKCCACDYCASRKNEKKVLWLGMAYADTDATTIPGNTELTDSGLLTPSEGRDTARCVSAEAAHRVAIYTVAKDSNNTARSDRHIKTDFSARAFVIAVKSILEPTDALFEQVALDYVWMPKGYVQSRMGGMKGFQNLLSGLAFDCCVVV
jgi:hypothetical protein